MRHFILSYFWREKSNISLNSKTFLLTFKYCVKNRYQPNNNTSEWSRMSIVKKVKSFLTDVYQSINVWKNKGSLILLLFGFYGLGLKDFCRWSRIFHNVWGLLFAISPSFVDGVSLLSLFLQLFTKLNIEYSSISNNFSKFCLDK